MQRVAKAVSLLMIFGSVTAPDASAADTWLTAERLLDVRSGRWIEQPGVLIREGRIISVAAKAANSAAPADAQVIALDGMSVIPGLIDMHVHLDVEPRYRG